MCYDGIVQVSHTNVLRRDVLFAFELERGLCMSEQKKAMSKNTPLIRDRVYQQIRGDILNGSLPSGTAIKIQDLSTRLNISGAPIREALNMLERDGLVELAPYRRAIVSTGTAEDYAIAYELRMFIEPFAARLSVHKIPLEAIEEARQAVLLAMDHPEDLSLSTVADSSTHDLLKNYTGSKVLSHVMEALSVNTMRYRYLVWRQSIPQEEQVRMMKETSTEHLQILQALELRDENLAFYNVYNHVKNSAQRNQFK